MNKKNPVFSISTVLMHLSFHNPKAKREYMNPKKLSRQEDLYLTIQHQTLSRVEFILMHRYSYV